MFSEPSDRTSTNLAFSEGFYNSYRRYLSFGQVSLAKFDARYYQKVRENGTTKDRE